MTSWHSADWILWDHRTPPHNPGVRRRRGENMKIHTLHTLHYTQSPAVGVDVLGNFQLWYLTFHSHWSRACPVYAHSTPSIYTHRTHASLYTLAPSLYTHTTSLSGYYTYTCQYKDKQMYQLSKKNLKFTTKTVYRHTTVNYLLMLKKLTPFWCTYITIIIILISKGDIVTSNWVFQATLVALGSW